MKKLLLLLTLISNVAIANCNVSQSSQLVSTRQVGEVTDLVKDIVRGKCTVKYRINVNDEWHNVTWSHSGFEDGEFLCNMAVENGRQQLLTMLGGKFESESIVTCKQGQLRNRPVKIGDEVLEAELGKVDEHPKYFRYKHATCRMFREKYNSGVLRISHGVICQADNQLWTVVDKW